MQSAAALAGALALRNKQLQEARASAEQLQQQVAQQQEDAARQLEAAAAQHEHEKVELQQDKQKHMRETLQLEVRRLTVGLLHHKSHDQHLHWSSAWCNVQPACKFALLTVSLG